MTILTDLGLNAVHPYTNNKAVPLPCADPQLLYGLELEIEELRDDPTSMYVVGMGGAPDNSLRGSAWEFITKPATFSVTYYILQTFFAKNKLTPENYTERCSIHVHANVQDMTPEQLKTLCLLYQVFERIFYAYAGEDRDKNIFCVPWAETMITHALVDKFTSRDVGNLRNWHKYTGLNLIPVTTQGTVEFRHLPGTCDLERIANWLNLIGCLFRTAKSVDFADLEKLIIGVNTSSDYKGLIRMVFQQWEHLVDIPHASELLEEGVISVKYMLLSAAKTKGKPTGRLPADLPQPGAWAEVIEDFVRQEQGLPIDWHNQAIQAQRELNQRMERTQLAAQRGRAAPNPFVRADAAVAPIRRR